MLSKVITLIFPFHIKKMKEIYRMQEETTEKVDKMIASINHDTEWYKRTKKED